VTGKISSKPAVTLSPNFVKTALILKKSLLRLLWGKRSAWTSTEIGGDLNSAIYFWAEAHTHFNY